MNSAANIGSEEPRGVPKVLTTDAVETFIADCHAALKETSPEPAPRGRTGESQEGGWDSTRSDVRSIDGHDSVYRIDTSD